ncbi:MAG: NAD(P)/FAD-dependent oxidoreductase [Desulfatibacillaceae bacterium]|nr:NAD(P)/FAD-dependent oxidoreductase [Desulfatibacillaceae bacterium]
MDKDILVIGGGTGGLTCALTLARQGFSVTLAEQAAFARFGNTWVNDTETVSFEKYNLVTPLPGELVASVARKAVFLTPDNKIRFGLDRFFLYSLRMDAYQKRLADLCAKAGVDIRFGCSATRLIYEGGFAKGALLRQENSDKDLEVRAAVTVLACGPRTPLMKHLPPGLDMDTSCNERDFVSAIQEVRAVDPAAAAAAIRKGEAIDDSMVVFMGMPDAGGYATFLYQLDLARGTIALLAGSRDQVPGVKGPRALLDENIERLGFCREKIFGGGRPIALRPVSDTLAGNGLALVGDAGFTVCPANGSGTVPSMISATLCADVVADALKKGLAPSRENLWAYNAAFHRGMGANFAGLSVVQKTLVNLTDKQAFTLAASGAMKGGDYEAVHSGHLVRIGPFDAISRLAKARGARGLLLKAGLAGLLAERVRAHYRIFPETWTPETFNAWKNKRDALVKFAL